MVVIFPIGRMGGERRAAAARRRRDGVEPSIRGRTRAYRPAVRLCVAVDGRLDRQVGWRGSLGARGARGDLCGVLGRRCAKLAVDDARRAEFLIVY